MTSGTLQLVRHVKLVVDIENRSNISVDQEKLQKIAISVMEELKLHPEQELSLSLVDVEEMAELHQKWMNESGPTDVMSFRLSEIAEFDFSLGDVVICPAIAQKDAIKLKKSPAEHLVFLLVHGILHLIGFDHQVASEKKNMQQQEVKLMKKITKEFKN